MISISAIVPAFNAEATIRDCLASVLSQTGRVEEVIVVDDGSSDRTVQAARAVDTSIRVMTTTNQGVSAARNAGADVAMGDFLAFLDADDLWMPAKLESQAHALSGGSAMSTTGVSLVDATGATLGEYIPSSDEDDQCEALLTRFMTFGPVSSAVIDRAVYRSIGGCSTALQQCADWDLFLRVARRGRIAVVPKPLTVRRLHDSNMSHEIDRLAWESRVPLDRYFAEPSSGSRRLERTVRGRTETMLAGSYFHTGKHRSTLRCVLQALKYDPRTAARFLKALGGWIRRGGVQPAGIQLPKA
jgi:glycosyltransferase involved in cell wall biosynthesis